MILRGCAWISRKRIASWALEIARWLWSMPVNSDSAAQAFKATLPLGCANNLNLMQMVEQRQDLNQGRATGPAMAAPVGRAAQVYIEGFDREQLQRRQAQQEAKAGAPGAEQ